MASCQETLGPIFERLLTCRCPVRAAGCLRSESTQLTFGSSLLEASTNEARTRLHWRGLHERLPATIEAQRTAAEQQRVFEDAARRVEDFRARRAQARRDAEALTKSLHQARARAEGYKALVSDRAQRVERVKAAEARHGELKQRIEAIKGRGEGTE